MSVSIICPGSPYGWLVGEPVALREEYDAVEGYYLVRDLDNPPGIFQEDELFNKVQVL